MNPTFPFDQSFAWKPNQETINGSNLMAFMRQNGIETYDNLYEKSIADVGWFWDATLFKKNLSPVPH